jgi:membrane protease YdiL (CAAX protease family)
MRNIRALELSALFWVYGTIAVVSLLLDFFSHGDPFWSWSHSQAFSKSQFFAGLLFVFIYSLVSLPLPRFFKWAGELEKFFRQLLTPISYFQILVLATMSGFIEEWFFRGVLLHHFGLIFSSLIFGLCHFVPSPGVWIWCVTSSVMGYFLGYLVMHSNSLVFVAILHSLINIFVLWRLNRTAHHRPAIG